MSHEHGAMLRDGMRCSVCGGNVVWSHWSERAECLLCCRPATGEVAELLATRYGRPRLRRRVATVSAEDDEVTVSAA